MQGVLIFGHSYIWHYHALCCLVRWQPMRPATMFVSHSASCGTATLVIVHTQVWTWMSWHLLQTCCSDICKHHTLIRCPRLINHKSNHEQPKVKVLGCQATNQAKAKCWASCQTVLVTLCSDLQLYFKLILGVGHSW